MHDAYVNNVSRHEKIPLTRFLADEVERPATLSSLEGDGGHGPCAPYPRLDVQGGAVLVVLGRDGKRHVRTVALCDRIVTLVYAYKVRPTSRLRPMTPTTS